MSINASGRDSPNLRSSNSAISSHAIRTAARRSAPSLVLIHASRVSIHGREIRSPLIRSIRTVTSAQISIPVMETSPSPIDACTSPNPKSAPGTFTGRCTVAPARTSLLSMFPPCGPGRPVSTGAPSGAVPITPTIGRAGNRIVSLKTIWSSRTGTIFVTYSFTRWPSTPWPTLTPMKPWSAKSMLKIATARLSPGSAPRTKIGPVAGFAPFGCG